MHTLLLDGDWIGYIVGFIISFLIGVFITRWIFGIDKIIANLVKQNEHSLNHTRLLKKMLMNQGTSFEEIDDIIAKGNQNPKTGNS